MRPKNTIKLIIANQCDKTNYTGVDMRILLDNVEIGGFSLFIYENSTYIESFLIKENHRNNGYGTQAIKELKKLYDNIWCTPDNKNAQRLYERLGHRLENNEYSNDCVNQGFGNYEF